MKIRFLFAFKRYFLQKHNTAGSHLLIDISSFLVPTPVLFTWHGDRLQALEKGPVNSFFSNSPFCPIWV